MIYITKQAAETVLMVLIT